MGRNPWLDIPLTDLEGHMALPEVAQAQMIADNFETLLAEYSPPSVAVIGCSGGNGFERFDPEMTSRVVGVDINPAYITQTRSRFAKVIPGLEMYVGDIQTAEVSFAPVALIYCALVLEYVDTAQALTRLSAQLKPGGTLHIVLQLPSPEVAALTPSPFTSLKSVMSIHELKSPAEVQAAAESFGFFLVSSRCLTLLSGKQFQSLSFQRAASL